jgi:NAD(P)H-hydrate epimerase
MSALRTGCGLLTAMIPPTASTAMLTRMPEVMQIIRDHMADPAFAITGKFNSIGIGPGAGTDGESAMLLYHLLTNYKDPLVIDADAITVLSKNKEWFSYLNQKVILTPHPAEFDRLAGEHETAIDRLTRQVWFSDEYNVTVILKGHRTSVVSGGEIFINTTGNDGMATAGSGDVLTGILTSLCAQGYNVKDAAVLGVYLHGFAGDIAAKKYSKPAMIASDIISEMGAFFKKFSKGKDTGQT